MKRPGRLLVALLVVGCVGFVQPAAARAATRSPSSRTQTSHVVRRGETLYSIARVYGVPVQRISSANRIKNPARIRAGMRLVIPGARQRPASPPTIAPLSAPHATAPALRSHLTAPLPWPVEGPVISAFMRPRRGHRHAGIDIKSEEGAPVRAVADGQVTLVAERHGNYGRLIAIEHENGMVSYYGHNRQNLVAAGQQVTAGDVIATVGHSGNATCDHLHFELHASGKAFDPIPALATPAPAAPREPAPVTASRPGKGAPDAASQR